MLGYRSVLSEEPVTLTVTALKDMEACYIPKKEILDAIKENPKFSLDMMRTVCHDLRDANMSLSNPNFHFQKRYLHPQCHLSQK